MLLVLLAVLLGAARPAAAAADAATRGRPRRRRRRPGPDLERRRPRGHAGAVGAGGGRPRSAPCRCAPPGRRPACSTAGRPSARATAPASRARTRDCRRCPLPTVPAAGRPGRPDAPPRTARQPEPAAGHHAVALRPAGAGRRASPSPIPRPPSPARPRTRAPRGSGPSPARSGTPSAAPPCRAGRPRWPSPSPGVEITRVDDLPDRARPARRGAGRLPAHPRLARPAHRRRASPGVDRTDEGTEPDARAAALQRIDAAVGRLRAAVATLDDDTLLLLAGISEVNDGRPQLHVGMAEGPGLRPVRLAHLGQHRPGAVRPAHRRGADGAGGARPRPAGLDERPAAAVERDPAGRWRGRCRSSTGSTPPPPSTTATPASSSGRWSSSPARWSRSASSCWAASAGVRPGSRRREPPASLRGLAIAAAALPIATYLAGARPVGALGRAAARARRRRCWPPTWSWPRSPCSGRGGAAGWARPSPSSPSPSARSLADVFTGSTLELNGLLGYDAIVAGRFTGYGNLTLRAACRSARSASPPPLATRGRAARRPRAGAPRDRRHRARCSAS